MAALPPTYRPRSGAVQLANSMRKAISKRPKRVRQCIATAPPPKPAISKPSGSSHGIAPGVTAPAATRQQWHYGSEGRRARRLRRAVPTGGTLCTGTGVVRKLTEALKWYRRSAEQGDRSAQYNLAIMLLK